MADVDNIIAVYKLVVYSSGKIETTSLPLEALFTDPGFDDVPPIFHPSSRIATNTALIERITALLIESNSLASVDADEINKLVSKITFEMSRQTGTTNSTISDKYSRQLLISREKYESLLLYYYKKIMNGDNNSELKEILLNRSSSYQRHDDRAFIIHSFSELAKQINSYMKGV